ncbi:formate/nitrite transporter [Acetitomaculum ruminis DSM 5522]|uniref:Formate/nitrite transporter n=1 Tax=Acetitomaculum ruminis DSM 5522 TaxID=1120918 RepID=A0A1I0UY09_9FIRM|nr:formate/nitrite transporter family protein [Acetitomaculum ruminis]SFA68989.1 formate/nitrite transporter [Acetitomaculum ruminis DSM 5522]
MNSPAEVAKNYLSIGKGKSNTPIPNMFLLAFMAGAFIAFGGISSTTAAVSIPLASVAKLVGAMIFPGGLAMVLIAGSELFTGNNLIIIPVLNKDTTAGKCLMNWLVVWLGNLVGGVAVAGLCVASGQVSLFNGALATSVISTAVGKCSLSFGQAFLRGIGCNFLVCIAVWMSFAAKDVVGKIAAIYLPITIFVLCGFEHSVANMYYISAGLFCKANETFAAAATEAGVDMTNLTVGNFFGANLLPVTLGNIVGGAIFVGCIYWFCYIKGKNVHAE